MKISFFHSVKSKLSNETTFASFIENIKAGTWDDLVLNYRVTPTNENKLKLPAITPSGIFGDSRKKDNIISHSGLINIDVDQKDNIDKVLVQMRDVIFADKYLFAGHISVGGYGLSLYFKIKKNKHEESFHGLEKYLAENYNIIIDPACKDVSRCRFVSYDPDAYINENAQTFDQYLPTSQIKPTNYAPILEARDIEYIFAQIKQNHIDLTANYNDWLKIGFAFASEWGQSGLNNFHAVSQFNPKYTPAETDKKFANILRSNTDKIKIGTFYWICKQNGINIKTEKTKKIETVTNLRKKSIGKTGGVKDINEAKESATKYLEEVENIPKTESKELIDRILSSDNELFEDKETSDIEKITEYIQTLPLKFNLITNRLEFNDLEVTDKKENSIFLNCKEMFPKIKFSKDLIISILNSDRIREYHAFNDFFEKNKYIRPQGRIIDLIDSIQIRNTPYAKYCFNFIEKWLLSIIASMHGTHSIYILVMVGDQMTGKTKFFRNLLPESLQAYYAESRLDQGKDDEMLMTQKLIVMNDEFGGISKLHHTKVKEYSSKDKLSIRRAYGRNSEDYKRIAVLCGTSNENEIINDPTGNRRIIPVPVVDIDFKKYDQVNKTELFMELYYKFKEIGNSWMLTKKDVEILNENTSDFKEVSIEEDLIMKCFRPVNHEIEGEFYTATDMLNVCEGYLLKQRLSIQRFGKVLRKLGYVRTQRRGIGFGYFAKKIIT